MFLKFTNHIELNFFALSIILIFVLLFSVDNRMGAGELILQINYFNNLDLFQDDIYIKGIKEFNARYYLVKILSYFVKTFYVSPEHLLTFLNRFTAFIIFYFFYLISQHFLRSSIGGLLSLLILLLLSLIKFNFGNFPIWSAQINAQSFFYMFFSIALYLSLKKYFNYSFILIGLGSLFHFLLGTIFFLFFLFTLLLYRFNLKKSETIKFPFLGVIICIVVLSFSLYPFFFNSNSLILLNNSEYVDLYVYKRHPHHYLLSSMSSSNWLFVFVSAGMLVFSRKLISTKNKNELLFLTIPLFLRILMLPVFYVFTEIFPNRLISNTSVPRLVSLCGLAYIPICMSLQLIPTLEKWKLFSVNFKKYFVFPFLSIIILLSIYYDVFSNNYTKLDHLKYNLLNLKIPKHYSSYLDLRDACRWVDQNNPKNITKIVAQSTESRYLCNRSMVGGSSFPFTSNDLILIDWMKERKKIKKFYSGKNINFKYLNDINANIAIISTEKKVKEDIIYRNDSFYVIKVNKKN